MDKNTQILFFIGFILLCLYLSCKNKEGFVVIEESLFDEQCSELGECGVFLSGQQGAECGEAVDEHLYTIPPIGTEPDGLTRSNYTGQNFNMTPTGCAAGAYRNDAPLSSQECVTEREPYTLTGCSPYCLDSDPGRRQGYIFGVEPTDLSPGVARPTTDDEITCAEGYTPAINTCFYKKGEGAGEIASISENACDAPGGTTEWFGAEGNIKIYCETGGENYILMGCEPECSSRINNVGDYLIVSDSVSETDYVANKERIETMDGRTMDDGALSEAQVMQSFPYTENAEAILAPNDTFYVNLTPSGEWTFHTNEPTTSQCNILDPDESIKNKYYVNGLYPTCDSSREECLNFNIEYSPGQPAPVDLVGLRNTLPTADIFQEGPTPSEVDIQKYQNSLYYFRRFKNSDGNDEIEAQIRCDTAQTSDYHCSFIPGTTVEGGPPTGQQDAAAMAMQQQAAAAAAAWAAGTTAPGTTVAPGTCVGFDCSSSDNSLNANPDGVTCAGDPCLPTECCTVAPEPVVEAGPPTGQQQAAPEPVVEAGVIGADGYAWAFGTRGADCNDTCATVSGLTCSGDGDWDVNNPDSFREKIALANQDSASLCDQGFTRNDISSPGHFARGVCSVTSEEHISTCSDSRSDIRRLCRCQAE
jgi:hypothetical protein